MSADKDGAGVTIRDVARVAGVSTTTISRFLNGKYDSMSLRTKERIEEAIRKLQYKPNMVARTLRSSKSRTLGIVFANILNPYSISVLHGAEEACTRLGYSLIVCNSNENAVKEHDNIETLIAQQVDGILVNSTCQNDAFLVATAKTMPLVLIDRKIEGSGLDTVSTDNYQGIDLAVRHLLTRGCGDISLVIASPQRISPRYERVRAFQDSGATLRFQSRLYTIDRYELEPMKAIIKSAMAANSQVNGRMGLILGNGVISLLALKSVRELKIAVPGEMLMVGIDDPDWASIAQPTLSVIAQPEYDVGRKAVETMLARLSRQPDETPRNVSLPVRLIERESSNGLPRIELDFVR